MSRIKELVEQLNQEQGYNKIIYETLDGVIEIEECDIS